MLVLLAFRTDSQDEERLPIRLTAQCDIHGSRYRYVARRDRPVLAAAETFIPGRWHDSMPASGALAGAITDGAAGTRWPGSAALGACKATTPSTSPGRCAPPCTASRPSKPVLAENLIRAG
jgi:hypothetical protein